MAWFEQRQAVIGGDFYRDASPQAQREYDGFGPWILEVKTSEDMPLRFKDHWETQQTARYLLKIPRDAERRFVRPGMDLYPVMLAIYPDRLVHLAQKGTEIVETVILLAELRAVQVFRALLAGVLTLWRDNNQSFVINYNAVSQPLMEELADYIRQGFPLVEHGKNSGARVAPGTTRVLPDFEDFYFTSLLKNQRRRRPDARLVYCEAAGRRCRDRQGKRARFQGLLVLETDSELTVITRGQSSRRAGEGAFVGLASHIPWVTIRSWALVPANPDLPGTFRTIHLDLGGQHLDLDLFEPEILGDFFRSRITAG